MKMDDFRYMRRGKPIQRLTNQQAHLLAPIDIRGQGHEHALLLLHGFSSSPAVFRQLLPAFTAAYDAVKCPTLPGHGESMSAFTMVKSSDWLTTAENAYETLVKDYQKVDVLGLSLGGLLACHLNHLYSVNHLYLLAPALKLKLNIRIALKTAHILHRLGFHYLRNRAGNLCSELYSELAYRKLPITAIIEILTMVSEFKLAMPTCPTDLFLGCFDDIVDSSLVEREFINLPNCNIHWLKNSAHVLPLDGDIDSIISCIQKNTGALATKTAKNTKG